MGQVGLLRIFGVIGYAAQLVGLGVISGYCGLACTRRGKGQLIVSRMPLVGTTGHKKSSEGRLRADFMVATRMNPQEPVSFK